MAKYDWFDGGYDKPKEVISEPAVHGEPLLEGWSGLIILVLGLSFGVIQLIAKPVLFVLVLWLGYNLLT